MATVKIDLKSSYGYTDPDTGITKYYGPGQGVAVPLGLAKALGRDVAAVAVAGGGDQTEQNPGGTPPNQQPGGQKAGGDQDQQGGAPDQQAGGQDPQGDQQANAADQQGAGANTPDAAGDLPPDYPARDLLLDAGFTTVAKVAAATDSDLTAISGIGKATVAQIRGYGS